MKRLIFSIALLVLLGMFSLPVLAQQSDGTQGTAQFGLVPPATKVDTICSGLLTVTAASQYMAPSTGYAVAYPKSLFQTEFGVSCVRGSLEFGGSVWNSQGFHRQLWGSNAEEVDAGAFVAVNFSHKRRLELRYTYLDLGPLNGSDYNNLALRYSRTHKLSDTLTVTAYAKADAYFRTEATGQRSGVYLVLGGEVAKELGKGWTVGANLHVAYDPYGTFGFRPRSVLYRQDYSVKYTRGSWSLSPVLTFGGANDDQRPGKITASLVFTRNFSFGKP